MVSTFTMWAGHRSAHNNRSHRSTRWTSALNPKHQIAFLLAACAVAASATPVSADDGIAQSYADDAVAALSANLKRLQSNRSVRPSQVEDVQLKLFKAQIPAARLRGDDAAQTELLQSCVDTQAIRLSRLQRMAQRGYAGRGDLRVAKLKLLCARQQLAIHSADRQALSEIITSALQIETAHLKVLQAQVSRGYTSTAILIDHKLRMAEMIASQHITCPQPDRW